MELKTQHLKNLMTSWRQDFHKNPELGFYENRTSKIIVKLLRSFGLEVWENFGETGVLGFLNRSPDSKIIAIRADMDALPIKENNSFSYKSKNDGIMHACGHDGHTSILLGAAKYLAEDQTFRGNVLFVFQPNEENGLGAKAMIKAGLFKKFKISQIYGLHNIPGMPVGYFATREEAITANESAFEIEVKTKGGHSALPNTGSDALLIGSQIVTSLQTIVSRKIDPRKHGVISVTEFKTNGGTNILASSATLRGDTRSLDDEVKSIIKIGLNEITKGICSAYNVSYNFKFDTKFPITRNDPQPTQRIISSISKMVGPDRIDGNCTPMLFSEDFSFLSAKTPGCFVLIGNGTTGANSQPLHSAEFDFNDETLCLGSSMWVNLMSQIFKD